MSRVRNFAKILGMLITWVIYRHKRSNMPPMDNPRLICVLYLSGLGDILCDTFFYKKLRERYPHAKLIAVLPKGVCEISSRYFQWDYCLPHESYWSTLRTLWKLRFDLVIIPGWLLRNSFLALFSKASAILGFINDLSFTNKYLNTFRMEAAGMEIPKVDVDIRKCHLAERPNGILKLLGMNPVNVADMEIPRIKPATNVCVIHAGARFAGRRWSEEGFARVIDHILDSGYAETVELIGDAHDDQINARIMSLCKCTSVHNLAGKLSLTQSWERIASAGLFIGNDSGPMHMAALAGVPTLGLMGPNFPHISGPLGKNSRWLFHEYPCTGCNQRDCAYAFRCIKAITVDEVIGVLAEMMER